MMRMNSGKESSARCPFSDNRLRSVLGYLKLWGCKKKNMEEQEKETFSETVKLIF